MGTQWTGPTLSGAEIAEQERHNLLHPGKVCQRCPFEVAHYREIDQRRADWVRREKWRRRWLPGLVLVTLIGCWLLGSWLLGPS